MSYFLAFAGFAALIVLHEFGHFTVAKLVGMRVERFALFFPPLIAKVRRGETEYGIGAIPLGGYVRITGMNPNEELAPEVVPRAYFNQPVWKRVVVILAGPAMNLLIAFVLLWALWWAQGAVATQNGEPVVEVARSGLQAPATQYLQPGDRVIAADGKRGGPDEISAQIRTHRCAGEPHAGCRATTPVRLTIERDGQIRTFSIHPRYDPELDRMRVGFAFQPVARGVGPIEAASLGVSDMWAVTRDTLSAIGKRFVDPGDDSLHGIVGGYEVTQQSFAFDTATALRVLALISLSLAVVNLFPFLPLDGGHVFWALAEKVRGRPIPFSIMERSGIVGFVLVIFLFVIGLSNDISTLSNGGFRVR